MPDNDGGVSKKLAGAKKALDSADKSNVSTRSGKPFGGDAAASAPAPAKKSVGILEGLKKMAEETKKEGESTNAGLKANQKNVEEYKQSSGDAAMPKMHKGGKVKKDGPHNLKKGEVVLTEKDAKKNGLSDGMKEADEEKSEKKDSAKEEKVEHKKKHKKGVHVRHASSGGFIAKHDATMGENGMMGEPEEHILPDMAALHAHMDEHMGEAPPDGAAQ